MLDMIVASGVLLLLGSLNWQGKETYVHDQPMYMHVYKYFHMQPSLY